MKTFQKRLYNALPRAVPAASGSSSSSPLSRARSNSASSSRSLYTASVSSSPLAFFESGGPPTASRPHVVARLESRVEVELHTNAHTHGTGQQSNQPPTTQGGNSGGAPPPWTLALSTPNSNPSSSPHGGSAHHSVSFFPYAPFTATPAYSPAIPPNLDTKPHPRRQRLRYHLDVGAYGIAKRRSRLKHESVRPRSSLSSSPPEDLHLAHAVGEDAYFVRENAMGVADGVGGWARLTDSSSSRSSSSEITASALFARRLMHFCSAELEGTPQRSSRHESSQPTSPPCSPPPTRAKSPNRPTFVLPGPQPQSRQSTYYPPMNQVDELHEELEETLEELEEGLDVLRILESAYQKTMKAHLEPKTTSLDRTDPRGAAPVPTPPLSPSSARPRTPDSVDALASHLSPALTLSSSVPCSDESKPLLAGSSTALVAILDHFPLADPHKATTASGELENGPAAGCSESGAVLRIANLGDSMGMLVRGEEIVWRSEEMWSSFNTPVQLGPRSVTRPSEACVITLPVQADDILILATDGLSDNLWDEEILDEVVRFQRNLLRKSVAPESEHPVPRGLESMLGRRTLAGMLSEALCSRARRVSERGRGSARSLASDFEEDEIPFARRAKEHGRAFRGGKPDDISVVVAVISPST